jgi:hypothetical protein
MGYIVRASRDIIGFRTTVTVVPGIIPAMPVFSETRSFRGSQEKPRQNISVVLPGNI